MEVHGDEVGHANIYRRVQKIMQQLRISLRKGKKNMAVGKSVYGDGKALCAPGQYYSLATKKPRG